MCLNGHIHTVDVFVSCASNPRLLLHVTLLFRLHSLRWTFSSTSPKWPSSPLGPKHPLPGPWRNSTAKHNKKPWCVVDYKLELLLLISRISKCILLSVTVTPNRLSRGVTSIELKVSVIVSHATKSALLSSLSYLSHGIIIIIIHSF